jgi:hypothetical protein
MLTCRKNPNKQTNKLHDIISSLDVSRQTVMIKQLFFDAELDHSYLLTNDNVPFCVASNDNFTVKHFLLEYHDFSQACYRFYYVKHDKQDHQGRAAFNSLKEPLNTIPSKTSFII